jgi:NTP pyrophosphatase (non-canonical NTP hydrolase)
LAISLSLEAAEILEHFQFGEEPKDKDELASELADVTLYLLQLASVLNIDLEQAVLKKIELNKSRIWDVES